MSPTLSKDALVKMAPHGLSQALIWLDRLDGQLRDRPFLLGDTFSIADAVCFRSLWFMQQSAKLFAAVTARPALAAWFARIEGFGPGKVQPMTAAEALAIAHESEPTDIAGGELTTVDGVALGDAVAITADDYGVEDSRGTVVRLAADEITIRHQDSALGAIAVHFPRAGYRILSV